MALVGIMAVGGGTAAFATEITSENKPNKQEIMEEKGITLEGLENIKANLDEKGLTLEEAKGNFESKVAGFATEQGLTTEEAMAQIAQMKENGKSFEKLKNKKENLDEKGLTLEEAKGNFESMVAEFAAEKGITTQEAMAQIAQMKENGKSLKDLKEVKENRKPVTE